MTRFAYFALLLCALTCRAFDASPLIQFCAAGGSWTPLALAPSLWLDASDAATLTLSGTNVTAWADKSGAGNHAVQIGSVSTRPVILASAQNGLAVVGFDGAQYLSTQTMSPTNSMSVFVVAIHTGSGAYFTCGSRGGVPSANTRSYIGQSFDGAVLSGGVGSQANTVIKSTVTWTSYRTVGLVYDGTTVQLYNAGTNVYDAAQSGSGADTQPYYIGTFNQGGSPSADYMRGRIAEIVVCKRKLSAAEITALSAYLSAKWGI